MERETFVGYRDELLSDLLERWEGWCEGKRGKNRREGDASDLELCLLVFSPHRSFHFIP